MLFISGSPHVADSHSWFSVTMLLLHELGTKQQYIYIMALKKYIIVNICLHDAVFPIRLSLGCSLLFSHQSSFTLSSSTCRLQPKAATPFYHLTPSPPFLFVFLFWTWVPPSLYHHPPSPGRQKKRKKNFSPHSLLLPPGRHHVRPLQPGLLPCKNPLPPD